MKGELFNMKNTDMLAENTNKLVLDYFNIIVIKRYCYEYNKSIEFGTELFQAFLKFMHISDILGRKKILTYIINEIVEIDKMWHTFLLFTREYELFCYKFFNRFIHHSPVTEENPAPKKEDKKILLAHFVKEIYQEFGKETLVEWFEKKKFA